MASTPKYGEGHHQQVGTSTTDYPTEIQAYRKTQSTYIGVQQWYQDETDIDPKWLDTEAKRCNAITD